MAAITTPAITFDPTVLPPEPVKRFTVEEYEELIRLGFLTEDDPYELLEGWLVTKMTKNVPHEEALDYLTELLVPAMLASEWRASIQRAIRLADGVPEPDVSVFKRLSTGHRGHPAPPDIPLVIEVSDATLSRDRGIKLRSYARAGIPEYWIVNLIDNQVEVYTKPNSQANPPTYAEPVLFRRGDTVPVVIEGRTFAEVDCSQLFQS